MEAQRAEFATIYCANAKKTYIYNEKNATKREGKQM